MNNLTLAQFFDKYQQCGESVNNTLPVLLVSIADACQQIARAVSEGALTGTMGSLDSENIQGEMQKQLDVISNKIFITTMQQSGLVAGMVSEELEHAYVVPEQYRTDGQYLILFDPLDGSSNVNVNITVGTIFSVLHCPEGIVNPVSSDFLQPGVNQVCAGYALYGSSTILVFTTGNGVNGFTLDNGVRDKSTGDNNTGEFVLTHPDMRIAEETSEFAINMSNYRFWEQPVQRYIDECLQGKDGTGGKDFNMRWVASMVAEVHRILTRGGIFLYPIDSRIREQGGKLRLLYEANPMGFIIEQAGGAASTGLKRILEVQPTSLHQRVPVILGSKNEVDKVVGYHIG